MTLIVELLLYGPRASGRGDPGDRKVSCGIGSGTRLQLIKLHLIIKTFIYSHSLMKHHAACWCPRRDTHTPNHSTHTQAVSLPLFHTLPLLTSSVTLTAHMQSDQNNIHTFFYKKKHTLIHACQLQALSQRHKQRANSIKPSAQHFHHCSLESLSEVLRLFLKGRGPSSLNHHTTFVCSISVQNV